ncbi:conserved hypothetical protein (DUF3347) [Formosa agariphila KMM 3901]|uniref:DUF3347 domain-containing protein n=1 Tax=Formosa agariphila (strain DSM 15362 / KCTC 12365 / LMG 23005 / KMM 3901 / M-2Alg 35-1) TaxID=1347342 RepID=T2KIB8_FORAG|nr:DUF3347 domain-containing protein [Formosa agariphila]CDF78617.1 conserved hypothetical protein (DUF3347) [Formosa agariphila KMM 3901]
MKNVKHIINATVLGIALISVVSCKNETKEKSVETAVESSKENTVEVVQAKPKFKAANVTATFQNYIKLKDALVNTDAVAAKNGAELIANTTENSEIKALASAIASESDIAKQREQFSDLTTLLKPVLVANLSSGEIYEQHCPMALKDGANWFAVEKEINNPYYGDKMLHCGLVQETLQ